MTTLPGLDPGPTPKPEGQRRFAGKVAMVTGAGRGIGKAIAYALAAEGCHLALCDIDADGATTTGSRSAKAGVRVFTRPVDVSDPAMVQEFAAGAIRRLGQIDLLVNNAGIVHWGRLEEITAEDWDRVMAVNLKGPFLVCQAVLPHMRERGAGRVVNLASAAARNPFTGTGLAYAVAKAGVAHLTRILAAQYGGHGIAVNALAPGPIGTDMVKGLPPDPGRWVGRVEDVVEAALFLLSDGAAHVSGEILHITAGRFID